MSTATKEPQALQEGYGRHQRTATASAGAVGFIFPVEDIQASLAGQTARSFAESHSQFLTRRSPVGSVQGFPLRDREWSAPRSPQLYVIASSCRARCSPRRSASASSARLGLNRAFRNTRIAYRASITPAEARFRAPHVGRNPADLVTAKVRFARRSLHSAQLQAGQSERNVHGHRSFDGDRLQGEAAS
jgi:hypothetical protein